MRIQAPAESLLPDWLRSRTFTHARVLVVDDDQGNLELIRRLLQRAGFTNVDCTTDSREAAAMFARLQPDVVLLDLHMPHVDGLRILDEIHASCDACYMPILMLTGDMSPEALRDALLHGAKDFVNKPFRPDELLLRIRTLLETRFLYLQIQEQNRVLEARVLERTQELESAQIEILERLAHAAEFRDDRSGHHTQRVGQMSALLAEEMGMSAAEVLLIRRAAPLHDVGKIGIPDAVLLKLADLTNDEFAVIKTHTRIGARILSGSRFGLLQMAEEIAFSHHERWDGSGYEGLSDGHIPLSGRIVAVADVFDALIQKRPYKAAWPVDQAVAEIAKQRGRLFDPAIVDAFGRMIGRGLMPSEGPEDT